MANLDLTKYGITGSTVIAHNPSYEELFKAETDPSLTGYEVGQNTELDAVNVMTGIYTGRSPKDKYIVMDANSKDTVWWTTEGYKNDQKVQGYVTNITETVEEGKPNIITSVQVETAVFADCHFLYGTAGFRMNYELLPSVFIRVGIIGVLRSKYLKQVRFSSSH